MKGDIISQYIYVKGLGIVLINNFVPVCSIAEPSLNGTNKMNVRQASPVPEDANDLERNKTQSRNGNDSGERQV